MPYFWKGLRLEWGSCGRGQKAAVVVISVIFSPLLPLVAVIACLWYWQDFLGGAACRAQEIEAAEKKGVQP